MKNKVLFLLFICVFLVSCANKEEKILTTNKTERNTIVNRESLMNNTNLLKDKDNIQNKTSISKKQLTEEIVNDNTEVVENTSNEEIATNNESHGYDAKIIWDKLSNYDHSNNGEKIVFLTFDDGPSTTITPKILEVLNRNNVKGTFFVLGKELEKVENQNVLKEIHKQGHAIGNHTYSHDYSYIYPNRNLNLGNFMSEVNKTNEIMKNILGSDFNTRLIRCPGGFNSWNDMQPLKETLINNNLVSIDWNSLSMDSEGYEKTVDELLNNVIETSINKEIVVTLMHDKNGKETTVDSLQSIIDYYKNEGYSFKTLY